MRIGEILVQNGVITAEQLEQALRSQVIHGGRLGTNLIELFDLDLDAIATGLAAQHQIPPATRDQFNRCNPEVQKLLSPELAAKLGAVPIGYLTGGARSKIAVAIMDPLAPARVEELSAALNGDAVLCIACELRIHYQLDHVYDIPRPNRFKRVRRATQPPSAEIDALPVEEREGRARREFVQTLSDVTLDEGEPSVDFDLDIDEESPEEKSRRHLARIAIRRVSRPPVAGEHIPQQDIKSFDDSLKAIRRATGRDKVADIAVDMLEHAFDDRFTSAIFFVVRRDLAIAWKGFVQEGEPPPFEQIALPLREDSVVSAPCRYREMYVGTPMGGGTELDQRLWIALGQGAPSEVAVIPIELYDEVVCLVYAHGGRATTDDTTKERLSSMGKRITAAFKRLIESANR